MQHIPVLLEEAIDLLLHDLSGTYLDGTFGRGGHSKKILELLNNDGQLIALDRDFEAFDYGRNYFKNDPRFKILHEEIANISKLELPKLDGVLLDLGICSTHILDPKRGFSFQQEGPLDMRMNNTIGITAACWINEANESEITEVLFKYGEEKQAKKIAKEICTYRKSSRVETTTQLATIISNVLKRRGKTHPATKTFQAIRIFINDELGQIKKALSGIKNTLKKGGVAVVISFHSLEDRLIKEHFQSKVTLYPKDIPLNSEVTKDYSCIKRKIRPQRSEIQSNPSSRSAIMRAYKRL